MSHTTPLSVRRALVLLTVGALGCGGGDLVLPDPPSGTQSVALTKVDGDEQIGTVGEPLPKPLVVQVLNQRNEPAPGLQVAFLLTDDPSAGTVTPDTATTNTLGEAVARWTLGTTPGSHTVVARLVGGDSASQIAQFSAAAKAGPPDTLSAQSALTQAGRRKQEVGTPPVVRVVDRYANPVEGASVAWQVMAGEGKVDQLITATDADGKATVRWTLGDRIGVQKLAAAIGSVTGSPVTFSATVLF